MSENRNIVVFLILGILLGGTIVYGIKEKPIELSCPEPVCEKANLSCPQPICERTVVNCQNLDYFEMTKVCLATQKEKSQLQMIAEDNAKEHDYNFGVYDCEQFSHQLIQRLNDAGYETAYCTGQANLKGAMESHAWVQVKNIFVEATNGKIISPSDFDKNYQIGSCN